MTTTKKATSKYTPSMEAAIRAAAPLNLAKAADLAATAEFVKAGVTARGIAAKCRSMNPPVEYEKVERTDKTGAPVAKKDDIVAEIEAAMGVTGLDSLAKAEKPALKTLLAAIKASNDMELAD